MLIGVSCRQDSTFVPSDSDTIFRDEYDGDELARGWTFAGGDQGAVSLTERPGFLRLYPEGFSPDVTEPRASVVLREFTGDFVLTTRIEFEPMADRQLSGLVVEGDGGGAVSCGLISAEFSSGTFVGLSLVADRGPDADPGTVFEAFEESSVYVRLERTSDSFRAAYSRDGQTYRVAGTVSNELASTVRVGVGTVIRENCVRSCEDPGPADFDWFEIGSGETGLND